MTLDLQKSFSDIDFTETAKTTQNVKIWRVGVFNKCN